APPARITVPGASAPAPAPSAPAPVAVEPAEATVIDPSYADLWKTPEGDGLEVPDIPKIDLSWEALDESGTDEPGGEGRRRGGKSPA
ncbi:MAG: hypothetical protein ACKO8G_07810, partial [Actinomycetota bacterium]